MFNSKGIGPVIAMALLLVVAVVSVVGFQSWFGTYSSNLFSNAETRSNSAYGDGGIENLFDGILYFKSSTGNITINNIKIGEINCNISGEYIGSIIEVDLTTCLSNLNSTGVYDIVLINENMIYKKFFFFDKLIGNAYILNLNEIFNINSTTPGYTMNGPISLCIENNYLYISHNWGDEIVVYDISNPEILIELGSYRYNLNYTDKVKSMTVIDNILYGTSYDWDAFIIINFTNKTNAVLLDYYKNISISDGSIYSEIVGDYAYIVSEISDSFMVLNISNKTNINLIGFYQNSTFLNGPTTFDINGELAFVATISGDDNFVVFNISYPTNISVINYYNHIPDIISHPKKIILKDNFVFMADDWSGKLHVFNVSDIYNITHVFSTGDIGSTYPFDIINNYLFLPLYNKNTTNVYDISNPSNLTLVNFYKNDLTLYQVNNILINGNYAYIISNYDITVLELFS